jgi:hypothetical protein
VTRSRSANSSVGRKNTVSSHNEPVDDDAINEEKGFLRGSSDLPPIIPNEQDRPLLMVAGKA